MERRHTFKNGICRADVYFAIGIDVALSSLRRPVLLLGAISTLLFLFGGCLSPSVRYTRDSGTNVRESAAPSTSRKSVSSVLQGQLEQIVQSYLGTPYKYGGRSREGLDCSGLVGLIYREVYGLDLPRSSGRMFKKGKSIPPQLARAGDLVFFRGGMFNQINHVGIYMGEKRFVHASSSNGVIYSELSEPFFSKRFVAIRRMY